MSGGAGVRQLPLVDLQVVKARMEETVGLLTKSRKETVKKGDKEDERKSSKKSSRSRHELLQLLRDDIVHYYQYSPELAEYFLQASKQTNALKNKQNKDKQRRRRLLLSPFSFGGDNYTPYTPEAVCCCSSRAAAVAVAVAAAVAAAAAVV